MTIQLLSPEMVAQIAAGEVIERPVNVVKELVENSLDAGARRIQVSLQEGGLSQIRIEDDGSGIPAESLALALQRHATSKIQDVEQLSRISTLGFRGEALYSIAAVSHVTLTSRTATAASAHRLQVECGTEVARTSLGRALGTTVQVDRLFVNTPVRKRFLKSSAAEAGRVTRLMQRMALAHPDVSFGYGHNGKPLLQTNGQGDVREFLYDVHGRELVQGLVPMEARFKDGSLSGYAGSPAHHFAHRTQIEIFVNGRWIQDRTLVQAVVQGYQGRLPIGRFPFALVFLSLDPFQVDVNVHPQKTEVRFVTARHIFGAVRRAVERALQAVQGSQTLECKASHTRNSPLHRPGGRDRRRCLLMRPSLIFRRVRTIACLRERRTSPLRATANCLPCTSSDKWAPCTLWRKVRRAWYWWINTRRTSESCTNAGCIGLGPARKGWQPSDCSRPCPCTRDRNWPDWWRSTETCCINWALKSRSSAANPLWSERFPNF